MLVLSLDGKMAVDIKAAGLEEGDTVTVTLSSGTQATGTLASVSGSTCTVTVTDNGTTYDDEVIVTDIDGKELGTGNLYIHEPLEITGTTGTVSAVNVSENESVTSGTELLTLENSASDAHYEQLLAERGIFCNIKETAPVIKEPEDYCGYQWNDSKRECVRKFF